ncbi:MAG: peroxidase [Chloroflexi bacterium]|nr:peroxidase [Chloroflexota bacterium]
MNIAPPVVDLSDVQGLVAFRRPAPYWGSLVLARIDNPERGRAWLRALLPHVLSAADWAAGQRDLSFAVALTHAGLEALGLPDETLASFPEQLRDGMAARADRLGDTGPSAPAQWEPPFGTGQLHLLLTVTAASEDRWRNELASALAAADPAGITQLGRTDVAALPGTRTTFGYRDGISFPNIQGLPQSPLTTPEAPLATGEFLLGYPSETGVPLAMPTPDVLGRNGSYIGLRKVHTRVAAFRRFLRANAAAVGGEELLAAKLVGRWRSGAPLVLAPEADDAQLASDPGRINNFGYGQDPRGLVCPVGAHIRRLNPRDSQLTTLSDVRLHRILRFGATYGPPLPEGALDDDGAERGIYFMFLSARPNALEFLKGEWINSGGFVGLDAEQDPIAGDNTDGEFTIPERPLRRRLHGLERFTVTRGGEYAFLPSLSALRWLAGGAA